MTVLQYLNQIKNINAKLANLKAIKEELRDQVGRVSGISYEGERVQTSVHGDALFNKTVRLMEIEAEYDRTSEELAELKRKIITDIHSLNSAEEIRVLYLRYVECYSMEAIAGIMAYSERHIQRIRDRAIQSFEDAFPDRFET